MPVAEPISIARLQIVIRCSTLSARTTGPAYSTAHRLPESAPSRPMVWRMVSLGPIQGPSEPVMLTRSVRDRSRRTVPVTSTFCALSPPQDRQPSAPCVQVWLSPATINMPGCVSPVSGPTTC